MNATNILLIQLTNRSIYYGKAKKPYFYVLYYTCVSYSLHVSYGLRMMNIKIH
jgi:hypothetical protein